MSKVFMTRSQRGIASVQIVWIAAGFLTIAAAAWHMVGRMRDSSVRLSTPPKRSCSPTARRITRLSLDFESRMPSGEILCLDGDGRSQFLQLMRTRTWIV